ncbi:MAG: hypothetical protein KDA53_15565 [Hyphomonas sp.]|nr:hypothetical protein [Hyphomonas sp.]
MSTQTTPPADSAAARSSRVAAIPPSQRAAVIIAVLGEAAAKPIVEKLDDAALAKVAEALENISFFARDQMVDIVMDFLFQLRRSTGSLRGGRDKAREVLSGVLDAQRLSSILGDDPFADTDVSASEEDTSWDQARRADTIWTRLEQRPPKAVATYLGALTPNIIALILKKLDVSAASNIVSQMDSEKLGPVMAYMIQGQKADAGIDQVLERMVEMEFLNVSNDGDEENTKHLAALGEMLSLIPANKRDSMVEFLKGKHDDKLKDIQKSLFTFESLPSILPSNAVPAILREFDADATLKLFASLRGEYDAVLEFFLTNISSRLAEQMREDLENAAKPAQAECEELQRDFLTTLMTMKRDGTITLIAPAAAEDSAEAEAA